MELDKVKVFLLKASQLVKGRIHTRTTDPRSSVLFDLSVNQAVVFSFDHKTEIREQRKRKMK